MTGYNVFVKEKFAEIGGEHKELSNEGIMRLVAGRWKNMSKEDQRPYLDLADQRNAPENVSAPGNAPGNTLGNVPDAPATEPTSSQTISCVWCDKTFQTKELAKTHFKTHMSSSSGGNRLNRLVPDEHQDHIKKCAICGLRLNERNLAEHMKNHGPEIELDVVDIINDDDNGEPEVTLEEASVVDDDVPIIVLVKLRTKYWPAEVTVSSSDSYEVVLCTRGEAMTVQKAAVKAFIPGLEICKGQSRDWKECYNVALELLENVNG